MAVLKPAARLFTGLPNLRQESAAVTAGEHQLGIAGLLAPNQVRYDGLVQASPELRTSSTSMVALLGRELSNDRNL
jgi:hypothetical protein